MHSRAKRNTHPELPSCGPEGHLLVKLEVDEMEQVHLERFVVLRHRCYMFETFLESREQEHDTVDQIGMQHDANELQQITNPTDEYSSKNTFDLAHLSL